MGWEAVALEGRMLSTLQEMASDPGPGGTAGYCDDRISEVGKVVSLSQCSDGFHTHTHTHHVPAIPKSPIKVSNTQ